VPNSELQREGAQRKSFISGWVGCDVLQRPEAVISIAHSEGAQSILHNEHGMSDIIIAIAGELLGKFACTWLVKWAAEELCATSDKEIRAEASWPYPEERRPAM
jgi:hypothetical protein